MSRDTTYRGTFTNSLQQTFTLYIFPASNAERPTIAQYVDIPEEAFIGEINGSARFRTPICLGVPEAEELKFTLDLERCQGSLALEDFRTYILNPSFVDGCEIIFAPNLGHPQYSRKFNSYNVVELWYAGALLFQGVQTVNEEINLTLEKHRPTILEISCRHIGAWVLENTLTDDCTASAQRTIATTSASDYIYTEVYKGRTDSGGNANNTYVRMHGTHTNVPAGARQKFTMLDLPGVFDVISAAAKKVYIEILRVAAGNFYVGYPYVGWTFNKHNTAAEGGGAYTTAPIVGNPYVVALIFLADTPTEIVGGLFSTEKDNSISTWRTAWDMLIEIGEASLSRGQWSYDAIGQEVSLNFFGLNVGTGFTVAPADFSSVVEITLHPGTVGAGTSTVIGGTGDDLSEITFALPGTSKRGGEYAMPGGFHNLPSVWPEATRSYFVGWAPLIATGTDAFALLTDDINVFTLFYSDSLLLFDAAEYVRVGSQRTELLAGNSWVVQKQFERPTINIFEPIVNETYDVDFAAPLRVATLEAQAASGMPFLSAMAIASLLAREGAALYKSDFDALKFTAIQLGKGNSGGAIPNASAFQTSATWLNNIAGDFRLTAVTYNYSAGTCSVEFYAMDLTP